MHIYDILLIYHYMIVRARGISIGCHSYAQYMSLRDGTSERDQNISYICIVIGRGGGLGSRPEKMYGERLGDGVEYHLMSPTPRR